jgi:hypothetical protein
MPSGIRPHRHVDGARIFFEDFVHVAVVIFDRRGDLGFRIFLAQDALGIVELVFLMLEFSCRSWLRMM